MVLVLSDDVSGPPMMSPLLWKQGPGESSELRCSGTRWDAGCWVSGLVGEQNSWEVNADLPGFPSRACSTQPVLCTS